MYKLMEQNFPEAMGNNPIENLIKPYPAIFNKIAASKTDPAVGASTWASGNQVWTWPHWCFNCK